ncbi:Trimethyllysine dioxygenase [Wallemia ichthyophaga EXF-994]|uniref:trimethyllysine dioxygenase n=1 Tax=Wallemia ichthyophaga (strain EXF-994 / CBS 113033) TaxID=1299270 RepID=R9AG01_WALI9|nr:Trimethyllysine dioxygenase [Wallemia ichthyophaga EXF-994]EOR01144.1 Trimethyllysine dioxygenase [Wallemia ichthyophaga EXF-994]
MNRIHRLLKPVKVDWNNKLINIHWNDNKSCNFHNLWLRDHSRDAHSFHPITKQRLVDTYAIPDSIQPIEVSQSDTTLSVRWNDNSTCKYPYHWLYNNSYYPKLSEVKRDIKPTWNAQQIRQNTPTTQYTDIVHSDKGILNWLQNIHTHGIGFVEGVPSTPEHTEQLTQQITFIRQTHYGTFWDFTSDLSHGDTAYTDIALGAHTDTTYFTDPIGLQLFHLLQPATVQGGDSLFIDGFHCANILKQLDPPAFDTLSTTPIPSHSVGSQDAIIKPAQQSGYPIINLDNITGELLQIRYNNDDRSVLNALSPKRVEDFYRALKIWNGILNDPRNQFWLPLEKGKVVLFDNWRILHGRSAFSGKRRLCGAYINHDDYMSRLRTLTEKHFDHDLRNEYGTLF